MPEPRSQAAQAHKLDRGPKQVTAMQFRQRPGYFFFRVIHDRESFIITHCGKAVARLTPIDDSTVIESNGTIKGEKPLTMRRNLGG